MTGFSLGELVPTWVVATQILKGDLPGHEFHGNQYTEALSSAGLNPVQPITATANIGTLLNKIEDAGGRAGIITPIGGSSGNYFGYRASEPQRLSDANRTLRDYAAKNGWQLHHLATFANSSAGGHYGAYAVQSTRATDEMRSQLLDDLASRLGLPHGA